MLTYPVHHIGIAVADIDASIARYQRDFSFVFDIRETVSSQSVEVAFLKAPNTLIELISPLSSTSPLAKFLSTRGEGMHHICYSVSDIVAELARLAALGHNLIDSQPRPGAHNSQIAFIHPKSMGGVLVELCQLP